MSRLVATMGCDVRLQFRNGFYWAIAFMLAFFALVILQLPAFDWARWVPVLIFSNLVTATFFFMAALVMLEKGEGTLAAQIVTPLSASEYLLSKLLTLIALSLVESLVLVLIVHGSAFRWLPMAIGIVCLAAMYCLAGLLVAMRYDSISELIFPSIGWVLLLSLPLLHATDLWPHPVMYLHPLQAPLVLMRGAFEPLAIWQWLYGFSGSVVVVIALFELGRRRFPPFVVQTEGVRR